MNMNADNGLSLANAVLCAVGLHEITEDDNTDELLQYWLHMVETACRVYKDSPTWNRRMGHLTRVAWAIPRHDDFYDKTLIASYTSSMFRARMRVSKRTFQYLCGCLAPTMQRRTTNLRPAISVERRVCIALTRLATGAHYDILGDLYGCAKSTACGIVLEFCSSIKTSGLHDTYIRWPSDSKRAMLAKEFESLRGIPYVIGVIDGSHIPIIAPRHNHADYYNRKGFHSILLQCTVAANCTVWDYDVGWAGSIHDSVNFSRSALGRRCESGDLGSYCLVGDAAYPVRPYMLVPYKGSKDGLLPHQCGWNFMQSSTRMAVERAFGMLKARFRILLKRCDMDLQNVPGMVAACLVLHNICIIHGDSFDMDWVNEAEGELREDVREEEFVRNARSSYEEVRAVRPLTSAETIARGQAGGEEGVVENITGNGAERRDNLARLLYNESLKKKERHMFGESEGSSKSSEGDFQDQ